MGNVYNVEEQIDKYLHLHMATAAERIEDTRKNLEFVNTLNSNGFDLRFSLWETRYGCTYGMTPEQLVQVRKLLNTSFTFAGKEAASQDARKPAIRVKLTPKNYPGVTLYYEKKLPRPRKGGAKPKCRLKRVTRHDMVLVCED